MFSIFVLSNMLVGYVGMLDFGFAESLTRNLGLAYAQNDTKSMRETVATGFWLLLIVGIIFCLLIYFGRGLLMDFFKLEGLERQAANKIFTITAIFTLVLWPMRLPQCVLIACLHIKEHSIIQAVGHLFSMATMLVLILLSKDVVSIRLGVFVVMALCWIPKILLVCRYVPELKWGLRFRFKVLKRMANYSFGMFYTRLISLFALRIDPIIIGRMVGIDAIAIYEVICRIFYAIEVNVGKFFESFLPTVFSMDTASKRHKLQTLLDQSVMYRALITTPLAYIGIIISPVFINLWMGSEYLQYAIWSQLFIALQFTYFFGVPANIARGLGNLRLCNIILTIRITVNVIISILLTPRFGIGGPILGTVITETLGGNHMLFPVFCKICGLKGGKAFRKAVLIVLTNIPAAIIFFVLIEKSDIQSWLTLIGVTLVMLLVFYGSLVAIFFTHRQWQDVLLALQALGITKIPLFSSMLGRFKTT